MRHLYDSRFGRRAKKSIEEELKRTQETRKDKKTRQEKK